MDSWQKVWREGAVPLLGRDHLVALRDALDYDDSRLVQGATTQPLPLQCIQDWACEGACAWGYCGWRAEELETVGEVEEFFARFCFEVDKRMGEQGACSWFLNWFDETPRDEMRRLLLPEVVLALEARDAADRLVESGAAG